MTYTNKPMHTLSHDLYNRTCEEPQSTKRISPWRVFYAGLTVFSLFNMVYTYIIENCSGECKDMCRQLEVLISFSSISLCDCFSKIGEETYEHDSVIM